MCPFCGAAAPAPAPKTARRWKIQTLLAGAVILTGTIWMLAASGSRGITAGAAAARSNAGGVLVFIFGLVWLIFARIMARLDRD